MSTGYIKDGKYIQTAGMGGNIHDFKHWDLEPNFAKYGLTAVAYNGTKGIQIKRCGDIVTLEVALTSLKGVVSGITNAGGTTGNWANFISYPKDLLKAGENIIFPFIISASVMSYVDGAGIARIDILNGQNIFVANGQNIDIQGLAYQVTGFITGE